MFFRKFRSIWLPFIVLFILSFLGTKNGFSDISWRYKGKKYNLNELGVYKGFGLPLSFDIAFGASSVFGGTISKKPIPKNILIFINYNQLLHYTSLKDDKGDNVPHLFHTNIFASLFRFVYSSPFSFANGKARIMPELSIPFLSIRAKVDDRVESKTGIGDIKIGLSIFWKKFFSISGISFDVFSGIDVTLPTAKYKKRELSLGNNIYDFILFYETFTKLKIGIGDGLFWKNHFQFLFYTKNRDFINPLTKSESSYLFGPNFQYNYMLIYKFNKRFGLGISGYYNKQLLDDKMGKDRIKGSKERSIGIGPILTFSGTHIKCSLRNIFDFGSINRPKGTSTVLILNFSF